MAEPRSSARVPEVVRVPPERRAEAAERLVNVPEEERRSAALRLVASASGHGIDLDLCWATTDPVSGRFREACLAVIGAGRTAMLFLPHAGEDAHDADRPEELAGLIRVACEEIERRRPMDVRIVQVLPAPEETTTIRALHLAGFVDVGVLSYLRRSNRGRVVPAAPANWGDGIEVRAFGATGEHEADEARTIEALDRSYVDTLDCPELCGLRETKDVFDSHRATGEWDPSLWWLVFRGAQPVGCMLFNVCRGPSSVELVYFGLAPELRGRGLGSRLLAFGLAGVRGTDAAEIACAVDTRNTPAMRLYRRAGFRPFAKRAAMVRPAR